MQPSSCSPPNPTPLSALHYPHSDLPTRPICCRLWIAFWILIMKVLARWDFHSQLHAWNEQGRPQTPGSPKNQPLCPKSTEKKNRRKEEKNPQKPREPKRSNTPPPRHPLLFLIHKWILKWMQSGAESDSGGGGGGGGGGYQCQCQETRPRPRPLLFLTWVCTWSLHYEIKYTHPHKNIHTTNIWKNMCVPPVQISIVFAFAYSKHLRHELLSKRASERR